jgi:prepilin-type N-terminal cleavage/methylation domain-containing protein
MNTLSRRTRASDAFTLVELMIVVTIVAILALVAISLYSQNTAGAIMSEGVTGCGTLRTACRTYYAQNNTYPATLATLVTANLIGATDLNGKYFTQACYSVTGTATTCTITATAPATAKAAAGMTYIIDQNGVESGTYLSGQ